MMQLSPCQRHFPLLLWSTWLLLVLLSSHLSLSSAAVGQCTTINTTLQASEHTTLGQAVIQINNNKEQYLALEWHNHRRSLCLLYTHTVCVHTLLLPNMLVCSLFCAGWNQTGQRAFYFFGGTRHFWESLSGSVTLRKEAHGMLIPLETALSVLSVPGFKPGCSWVFAHISLENLWLCRHAAGMCWQEDAGVLGFRMWFVDGS